LDEDDQERLEQARLSLREMMADVLKGEEEAENLRQIEGWMMSTIKEVKEAQLSLEVKVENWVLREKRLAFTRSARDRLRSKAFLVLEQLHYYKITIQCLSEEEVYSQLTPEEAAELEAVVGGALKIINMYIEINNQRNSEFLSLYHEEAEGCWYQCEEEWKREASVWDSLMDRLIDTFLTIFVTKLEDNVSQQEVMLTRRGESFQRLTSLTKILATDDVLSSLLSENVASFTG
jgi:hypothetical protein